MKNEYRSQKSQVAPEKKAFVYYCGADGFINTASSRMDAAEKFNEVRESK